MLSEQDRDTLIERLSGGQPPPPRLAAECLVGHGAILAEWTDDLSTYVKAGGSLLRIVVGAPGRGKTHLGEALLARAAEGGFLVCKIDEQAQGTTGEDLALHRAVCQGLTLPEDYLDGDVAQQSGLAALVRDVSERLTGSQVRAALRPIEMPIPAVKDAIAAAVDAARSGLLGSNPDPGWMALLSSLGGERLAGMRSISALRSAFALPFTHLKRLPGRRDGRLWLESVLISVRPLGYAGVVVVLDEHDDANDSSLRSSIAHLRRQLDRVSEGHLPGTFVLYLALHDLPDRVHREHAALEQRIAPILNSPIRSRLLTDLSELREGEGEEFLIAIATRLHEVALGRGLPRRLVSEVKALATDSLSISGADPRQFVQRFAEKLHDACHDSPGEAK
jgi:bacteriophage exclusion system BrxC/D-like protein